MPRSKTMHSFDVVGSDSFFELSPKAQLLYFYLPFFSDNDGAVEGVKRVLKFVDSDEGALGELEKSGLLVECDGVYVIKDWWDTNSFHKGNYRAGKHVDAARKITGEPKTKERNPKNENITTYEGAF